MKRAVVVLAAVAAVIGLRQVIPRVARKMREHCEQMTAAARGPGEPVGTT